jgi:hypothetical protein
VSTCAYEAIVQTPAVCEHPMLKVRALPSAYLPCTLTPSIGSLLALCSL